MRRRTGPTSCRATSCAHRAVSCERRAQEVLHEAARDAERHVGKARRVDDGAGIAIVQARFPAGRFVVADQRELGGHEQILDDIGIAAGAAQADDVPVVADVDLVLGQDEGPHVVATIGPHARLAVGFVDQAVRADPGGMAAAARERRIVVETVAADDGDRLGARVKAPRQARPLACRTRGGQSPDRDCLRPSNSRSPGSRTRPRSHRGARSPRPRWYR